MDTQTVSKAPPNSWELSACVRLYEAKKPYAPKRPYPSLVWVNSKPSLASNLPGQNNQRTHYVIVALLAYASPMTG